MCLILDASKYGDFLKLKEDMKPVREWLEKKSGKMVYSPTEMMERELKKLPLMREQVKDYTEKGIATTIDKTLVEKEMRKLTNLKSNDPHIIALAIVSGAKLLVSSDRKLHKDFKKIRGAKIYKRKEHERLLKETKCSQPP